VLFTRELKNDEYEGSETDRVAIIVGQSPWARKIYNFTIDTDIDLPQEKQGVSGAMLSRQSRHLLCLVGGQTYAHSLILVFPDIPQINQEQPIRTALSTTTVSFNTADDIVGPPWAAVYIMVSNAREYLNEEEQKQERPERPEGEDFKISSADRSEAIKRGQTTTTRVNGRQRFADLISLSAKEVIKRYNRISRTNRPLTVELLHGEVQEMRKRKICLRDRNRTARGS
jgi:hypothetical protein